MLWVAGGGAIGAVLRYLISVGMKNLKLKIPATLVINLLGSFGLGVILALYDSGLYDSGLDGTGEWLGTSLYLAVCTGFFGAFTTFSTFSVEAVELILKKVYVKALGYILLMMLWNILFFFSGYYFIM